jgi:hypothetical protein
MSAFGSTVAVQAPTAASAPNGPGGCIPVIDVSKGNAPYIGACLALPVGLAFVFV